MTEQNDFGGSGTPTSPWAWVPKEQKDDPREDQPVIDEPDADADATRVQPAAPGVPFAPGSVPAAHPGVFPPVGWIAAPPAPSVPVSIAPDAPASVAAHYSPITPAGSDVPIDPADVVSVRPADVADWPRSTSAPISAPTPAEPPAAESWTDGSGRGAADEQPAAPAVSGEDGQSADELLSAPAGPAMSGGFLSSDDRWPVPAARGEAGPSSAGAPVAVPPEAEPVLAASSVAESPIPVSAPASAAFSVAEPAAAAESPATDPWAGSPASAPAREPGDFELTGDTTTLRPFTSVADPPMPAVLPAVPASSATPTEFPHSPLTPVESAVPYVAPPTPPEIFRDDSPRHSDAVTDEERKLAAERAARREARIRALSTPTTAPVAAPTRVVVTQRSTDKFFPSLGLLLLRIAMAGLFGIRGIELLANRAAAEQALSPTVLPEPSIWVLVAGFGSVLVALGLLLGLATRAAGVGAMLIGGGALAFVMWGPTWSPFDTSSVGFLAGQYAFLGEFELLAAVVGFMFLCVGGGGIAVDRAFRRKPPQPEPAATVPGE